MSTMKNESILKKFGAKAKLLRTQRKLSQERFASKTGLHWTYISGIERGKRNISILKLIQIAKALNINATELMDFR